MISRVNTSGPMVVTTPRGVKRQICSRDGQSGVFNLAESRSAAWLLAAVLFILDDNLEGDAIVTALMLAG